MKNSYKLFLRQFALFVLLCCSSALVAQVPASYLFSTNATSSLTVDANANAIDMTTGTTPLVGASSDQGVSAVTTIGFTFPFSASNFTQYSASANGMLQLGATAVSGSTYTASSGTAALPKFTACGADMITSATGSVTSKVVGTAPNRCLVVQWTNIGLSWLSSAPDATYQVRLYENGNIEYVYGKMIPTGSQGSYSIGFSNGTTASSSFVSVLNATNTTNVVTYTLNTFTAGTAVVNLNSTTDGSRRMYRFTVPPPCSGTPNTPTVASPVGGVINICSGGTAAMSVAGVSNDPGIVYQWEQSTDNSNFIAVTTGTGGTTTSYTSAALTTFPMYFRMKTTCTPSTLFTYSPTVTVNSGIPPSIAASAVLSPTAGLTTASISCTAGNGGYRLIYINNTNSFTDPAPGSLSTDLPTAALAYTGTGQQLVANGTGTTAAITGLAPNTTYYVKVYEFLRCGTAAPFVHYYNTTTPVAVIQTKPALTYSVNRAANISYNSVFSTADTLIWSSTSTDDQLTRTTYIPFNFTFQGKAYNAFKVSTNGYITFDTVTTSSTAYGGLFTSTTYNAVIAAFSNDLVTPGNPGTTAGLNAAIRYKVQGTAPNRTVTIEFLGMEKYLNPGPNLNFQIILTETTNTVQIVYGAMEFSSGGSNAAFAYALGLKGTGAAATPLAGEVLAQIEPNTTVFSHINPATANRGLGNLVTIPDCNSALIFTPSATAPAFTVSAQNAPRNDEYTNAIDLSSFIGLQPCTDFCGTFYNTQNATQSTQALPSATFGTNDDDVWFSFTPNNSVAHTLNVFGSNGYQARAIVYNDPNNPTDTVVTGLATGAGLTTSLLMPNVQQGSTYYVRVYHNGAGGSGAIATATVTGGVVTAINIVNGGSGYTAAPTITFYGGSPTTAATATATVTSGAITGFTITAGGAGYVTAPSIYIPYTGAGGQPTVSMCLFETPTPPTNDNASGAQLLTSGGSCINITGNTLNATASATANACAGYTPDDDIWYKFVAPNDASNVVINVQSLGSFNAAFEVLYGGPTANPAALTSIGCINSTSTGGLEVATGSNLLRDSTYFIRVYHYTVGAATGRFTICLTNACPTVTANAVTNIGIDSARANWSSAVGRVLLEYGATGFTPGTGATAGTGGTVVVLDNVNTYKITGLIGNTTYDYYVRRFCSSTNSYTTNGGPTTFTTLLACANPPAASNTVSTVTSICNDINFTLSLSTTYTGFGLVYQWQSSPDGTSNWTNISGATSATRVQQLTTGGDQYFRCTITCSGGTTTNSAPIFIDRVNPAASTTLSTATAICNNANFTLSLGTTYGSSLTYQWQSSPDGTTFANITGATSATRVQQLTTGSDQYFRCVITCAGGASVNSTSIFITRITIPTQCYCEVTKSNGSGSLGGDGITNVTFANLNNSDNTFLQSYVNFSTTVAPAIVTKGTTVPLSFSVGTDPTQYYGVWIDWDQSGTFEASELVAPRSSTGASSTVTLQVAIPTTAVTGTTRLRVRAGDDAAIATDASACDGSNNAYGETEDYAVMVLPVIAGSAATCSPTATLTSTGSGNWLHAVDGTGNLIFSLKDDQNLGTVSVSYVTNASGTVRTNPADGIKYLDRNFGINSTIAPTSNVTMRLYATNAEVTAFTTQTTVPFASTVVTRVPGADCSPTFSQVGQTAAPQLATITGRGDAGLNGKYWDLSVPGFSGFYIHGGGIPIPVELQSFRAYATAKVNTIEWVTATERNTQVHIVERSANGISNWVRIGQRTAANNSSKPLNYTLNDNAPQCLGYYRLRTIDLDGKETVSKAVSVERLCGEFSLAAVFPNPTDESVTVRYEATQQEAITITVTNVVGQILSVQNAVSKDGFNDLPLSLSAYATGTYFITLSNGTTKITQRIVKN
jgi:hypothetical protein